MLTWLKRIGLGLLALILILALVAVIYVPRAAEQSFPTIDGEIQLSGLDGAVDIYRDSAGIPHIYASTTHDLFFAQGYVHAQDRFWQMDFNRHVGAGRLSELMGGTTTDTDLFLRTLGWERVARAELELLDAESLQVLEAYSEGVNAYIAERSNVELGLEYLFLNILNSNYEPQPWEPLNVLTWAKAMAWDLRGNMDDEIERAILLGSLSAEMVDELYPAYPDDKPIMVPDFSVEGEVSQGAAPAYNAALLEAQSAFQSIDRQSASLDALRGIDVQQSLGSNSWAVSGELSATGMPLLANDPHLGASMPSIWYLNGLHCQPVGPDCPYEVTGVSFPGAPGVVIGHNARIAWGFTNTGPDVMDLYLIRVNPDDENQYEMNGEWVDMDIVTESVQIAGGDTIELPVRVTQFGPIISDTYGDLAEFNESAGIEMPDNYAVALRWTALEPGYIIQSVLKINRAQNFDEFRDAARDFSVPAQNLLYADVDGNIGYQMPGNIPLRAAGDGRLPVPGWTDEYAWQGYIPFEQQPFVFNPKSGYIVTANNAVVGADYPYLITDSWDYGYRAQRIVDMIEAANGPIDGAYFQAMQDDSVNLGALDLLPYLMAVDLDDADLEETRSLLAGWDGSQTIDSVPAALFNAFWVELLENTFHDQIPEDNRPGGGSSWYTSVALLMEDPDSAWWDDVNTEAAEERDAIIRQAFAEAVARLEDELGSDPAGWAWGDLHTITFNHEVMSNFPLINTVFNRGPFAVPGGSSIVNATGWSTLSGSFEVTSLPSKRSIMDTSNWQNSLQITTTGQSGHPYHDHYIDMAPLWAQTEYLTMHWERSAVEANAEGHLRLVP